MSNVNRLRESLEARKRQPSIAPAKQDNQFYTSADAAELILDLPRIDWPDARVSVTDAIRKAERDSEGISTERLRRLCDMTDAEFAEAPEARL